SHGSAGTRGAHGPSARMESSLACPSTIGTLLTRAEVRPCPSGRASGDSYLMRTWQMAVVAWVLGLVTGLLASRHSPGANPKPIPTQPEAALVSKIHPARKVVQS